MDITELKRKIEAIDWWHSIDLGNGLVTPGRATSRTLLDVGLPKSLAGKTVLDIGAWDGFFSFEAHRRGATRVLATDSYVWELGKKGFSKEGFLLAKSIVAPEVDDMNIDVLDISPEKVGGTFDIVLFLGVLYHMRHPLLALERVYSVTEEMAIIETITDMLDVDRPALGFYPGSECYADPTNWFAPNPAATVAMLDAVGFRKVQKFSEAKVHYRTQGTRDVAPGYEKPSLPKRLAVALARRTGLLKAVAGLIPATRVVFHAWK